MPTVKGPLFSLAASGTYRNAITYSAQLGRNIARGKPSTTKPPTPAQIAIQNTTKNASIAWNSLTTPNQAQWQAAAQPLNMNGYAYFVRQYHLQAISPPHTPSIP